MDGGLTGPNAQPARIQKVIRRQIVQFDANLFIYLIDRQFDKDLRCLASSVLCVENGACFENEKTKCFQSTLFLHFV